MIHPSESEVRPASILVDVQLQKTAKAPSMAESVVFDHELTLSLAKMTINL
jgi:hypothetical protein